MTTSVRTLLPTHPLTQLVFHVDPGSEEYQDEREKYMWAPLDDVCLARPLRLVFNLFRHLEEEKRAAQRNSIETAFAGSAREGLISFSWWD